MNSIFLSIMMIFTIISSLRENVHASGNFNVCHQGDLPSIISFDNINLSFDNTKKIFGEIDYGKNLKYLSSNISKFRFSNSKPHYLECKVCLKIEPGAFYEMNLRNNENLNVNSNWNFNQNINGNVNGNGNFYFNQNSSNDSNCNENSFEIDSENNDSSVLSVSSENENDCDNFKDLIDYVKRQKDYSLENNFYEDFFALIEKFRNEPSNDSYVRLYDCAQSYGREFSAFFEKIISHIQCNNGGSDGRNENNGNYY